MTSNEEEESLPAGLGEKIQFCIRNSVIGIVKSINEDTIEEYCEFIQNTFPTDEDDWPDLKKELVTAAKKGPKIFIQCTNGKITGYEKTDNLRIVAFLREESSDRHVSKIIDGTIIQSTETNASVFSLSDYLMIPYLTEWVLRVEVRKVKASNEEKVIGFTEIPQKNVFDNQEDTKYKLQKADTNAKITLKRTSGHLMLNLSKDDTEINPNISVPKILKSYLQAKAKLFFKIDASPVDAEEEVSYLIRIAQNMSDKQKENHVFYQKILTKEGKHSKNEDSQAAFNIDCILSNKLEVGAVPKPDPVSPPRKNSIFSQKSPKRYSSSLSITDDELSPTSLNLPNNSFSFNINDLSRRISVFSVMPESNLSKLVNVKDIVSSEDQKLKLRLELEYQDKVAWDTKIELFSDVRVTRDELRAIHEKAISEAIRISDGNIWDGSFPTTIQTVLNMIKLFAIQRDVKLSISEAFIKMSTALNICNLHLKTHIKTVLKENTSNKNLKIYGEKCLAIIELHRNKGCHSQLSEIVDNLKLLVERNDNLTLEIKNSIEKSSTKLFDSWQEEITRKKKDNSSSSKVNAIEICNAILRQKLDVETRSGYKVYQEVFQDILDYKQFTGETYLNLCKEMIQTDLLQLGQVLSLEVCNTEDGKVPFPDAYADETDTDDFYYYLLKEMMENCKEESKKHDDYSPFRQQVLEYVYDSFSAFKRIFKNIFPMKKYPSWLFEIYEPYPNLWLKLALYKANIQVGNIIKHVTEIKEKGMKKVSSQYNSPDVISDSLVDFLGVAETCWTFKKELAWPDPTVNINLCVDLIYGLAQCETRILNVLETFLMKDKDYDALDLSKTIDLLEGLLARHRSSVDQISLLDKEAATDKVVKAYEHIENAKNRLKEEAFNQIRMYCESKRPILKNLIANKNLIDENDDKCLMSFVDKEMQLMHTNIDKKYQFDVMNSFWTIVEEELESQFQDRLNRNLLKNKPSRFSHFKDALPVIIDFKKRMHEDGIISHLGIDTLSRSKLISNKILKTLT